MSYMSLESYYSVFFNLVQHYKYSITELENMFPFERDLFVESLVEYIKKKEAENVGNGG